MGLAQRKTQTALATSAPIRWAIIAEACAKGEADHGRKGPLNLPNLTRLGLVKAHEGSTGKIAAGMDGNAEVIGAYAWAHELSSGKDTPSGHWEIAGVPVLFDWGYFSDQENSFAGAAG